jgi:NodT family efflux transporter outer membrane factor (OMF) lipoprotein
MIGFGYPRRVSFHRAVCASLVLCVLTGCTVGPGFVAPDANVPAAWHDASVVPADGTRLTTDADPDPRWWSGFNDPTLTSLIERATRDNPDVQIAVIRVAEARASEGVAAAAKLPTLGATGVYTRADFGQGLSGGGASGSSTGGSTASGLTEALTQPVNIFAGVLDASWELDLFGKVRRSVESARAAADAALGNRDDALVTIEAEVAETYAQLRAAQESRDTAQSDLDIEQQVLELTRERNSAGLVTQLDVENAATTLATTEAALAQYDQQIAASLNGLAVLVGEAPGALDAELTAALPIPAAPPEVPIGLPSALAHRRPDIRVAEADLHRQTANIGVATAQFYPDVSLTGLGGVFGTRPKDLTLWADRFYAFGPSVSLPIFEGGKLRANLKLAKAQQAEAAVAYRKTVLGALQDVENALAAYRTELRRHQALEKTVAAQTVALEIARNQYLNGVTTFINVLTAENSLAQQHQALIQSTLSLTTDVVNLYKALGGGWQRGDAAS